MSAAARLTDALADRSRIEREQGGMARELVTEVTTRLTSLKRPGSGFRGRFSDHSRAVASATRSGDATGNPDA